MFPCELTGVTVHLRVDDADFAVLLCFFSRLGRPRAGHDVVGASVLFEPNQVERNGAELSGPPTLQEQHLIVVWDVSGEEHVRLLGESFRISRAATKVTYNNSRRRLSVLLMILLKSEERWLISDLKRRIPFEIQTFFPPKPRICDGWILLTKNTNTDAAVVQQLLLRLEKNLQPITSEHAEE